MNGEYFLANLVFARGRYDATCQALSSTLFVRQAPIVTTNNRKSYMKRAYIFAVAQLALWSATGAFAAFVHPGCHISQEEIAFVKARLAAGEQPWTDALGSMIGNSQASMSYSPDLTVDISII
jgi:hypothetical protein